MANGRSIRPRVYYARGVEGLPWVRVSRRAAKVRNLLARHGIEILDPVALGRARGLKTVKDIVESDLSELRRCDAVFMDMSLPNRNYVGCCCELVYAFTWGIPTIIYVGRSGNGQRTWLKFHAAKVCKTLHEGVHAVVEIFRTLKEPEMNDLPDYMRVTREFYDFNASSYAANTSGMLDVDWLKRFCDLLPDQGDILDVGCAAGRDSAWFAERGYWVSGIDISPIFIAIARDRVPGANFKVMSVTTLQYPEESFDGVWCSCVLIHLTKPDAAKAIQEVRRVLRPGAVLFVLVKAGDAEGFEEDSRYWNMRKYSSYYSAQELRQLLVGFDLLDLHSVDKPVDTYRAPDRIFCLARKVA